MIRIHLAKISLLETAEKRVLLRDIAFAMSAQNIYTIIGKNGEGKTTLLKAVTNFLDENVFSISGAVEYEGINLLSLPQKSLAELRKAKIQYVFQDPVNAFDPLKKIGYYFKLSSFDEDEIKQEFEDFNLAAPSKIFSLYPYEVSGGMAQRIAIILALLKKPKFLLLDEPTSGIDGETILLVKERLKKYVSQNNAAVLIITQDLSFAENVTNYIAYLEEGRLSEFVSYKDFFANESPSIKNFLNAYKRLNNAAVS